MSVLVVLAAGSAMAHARAHPHRPVLVELFTAQGCSTCAKANAEVARLVDRPGLIVLTWPVDYWDYLGWKDTFAQPAFGERQRRYDTRFGLRDVYTPQVVVGGMAQGSGDRPGAVEDLVRQARAAATPAPEVTLSPSGRIAVGSGRRPHAGAEVWLVRFDPAEKKIEVTAGDNRGATVTARHIVRQAVRLGPWSGRPATYRAPSTPEDGLATVVIVEEAHGGPVLGLAMRAADPS